MTERRKEHKRNASSWFSTKERHKDRYEARDNDKRAKTVSKRIQKVIKYLTLRC